MKTKSRKQIYTAIVSSAHLIVAGLCSVTCKTLACKRKSVLFLSSAADFLFLAVPFCTIPSHSSQGGGRSKSSARQVGLRNVFLVNSKVKSLTTRTAGAETTIVLKNLPSHYEIATLTVRAVTKVHLQMMHHPIETVDAC